VAAGDLIHIKLSALKTVYDQIAEKYDVRVLTDRHTAIEVSVRTVDRANHKIELVLMGFLLELPSYALTLPSVMLRDPDADGLSYLSVGVFQLAAKTQEVWLPCEEALVKERTGEGTADSNGQSSDGYFGG
jgi:hypothetical protein